MLVWHPKVLRTLMAEILVAVGFPEQEAQCIAALMVEANLTGHDTHGVRLIRRYVELVRNGLVRPGAPLEVEAESPVTLRLNANSAMGHVAASRAVELGIEKTQRMKLAAVGVRNLDHVGRVGAYAEQIARAGFVGLLFVNAQDLQVVPYGGLAPRLGTNPMAAGFPRTGADPLILDFATSTVAANKIRRAHARKEPTGEGWIVDRESGAALHDPQAFMDQRAWIPPLGGPQGHKGYALAILVDIFSGILAGAGSACRPSPSLNNGTFIFCIDPEAFLSRAEYDAQLTELATHLRDTPPLAGREVLLPGDYEARRRKERAEGIPLDDVDWQLICDTAACLHITPPEQPAAAS